MHAPVAVERGDAYDAEQVEAEQHDERAADARDPDAEGAEQAAEHRRRRAESDEDQREAEHEQQRVDERRSSRRPQIVEPHPGDEGEVARHQREDAGREKAQQPGAEGQREADRCGFGHR